MKLKGLFTNTAEDLATGLLIAAIVLLIILASLKLLAHEIKPSHDFRASIETEIVLPDQHIFP